MILKHFLKWFPSIIFIILGFAIGYLFKSEAYNKYIGKLNSTDDKLLADGQRIYYADIDGDGISEQFIYYHLSDNKQPVVNQYNAKGAFEHVWYLDGTTINVFDFLFGDYDCNGQNEIYLFSVDRNSLYLYGIEGKKSNEFTLEKTKVISLNSTTEQHHIIIHSGGLYDLNNDGKKEVVFSVTNRYTNYPRKVIAYDIHNDTVLESPEIGLQLVGKPNVLDIDNDGKPEIFISTLNSTNYTSNYENNNSLNAKTIVLNNELNFKFQPIPFLYRMSISSAFPYKNEQDTGIVSLNWSLTNNNNGELTVLDAKGNEINKIDVDNESFVFDQSRKDWTDIRTYSHNGSIKHYNNNLELSQNINVGSLINQVAFIDIDKNGTEEIIIVKDNSLLIYEHDYQTEVEIHIPGLGAQKLYFSVKESNSGINQLSIQNNTYQYLVSYYKHPYYWTRYIFYMLTSLTALGIFLLLRFLFNKHIENIRRIERESTYMHIDLMKNQLDPHFLFNALNSIAFSINKDDRKTAYKNLGIFSKFMREAIVSIDDYGRSLEDELNFVKYYLELEKFRFKEKFNYDIILSPEVSKSIKIPKMCIFSYVESALKKGVLPNEAGGRIEIKADILMKDTLTIAISDNGLHRSLANKKGNTKNMIVMERSIKFYNKFNALPIKISYVDRGSPDEPKGSKIEVHIPMNFTYNE